MTLNRYSHVTPSMQRHAADALDKAIDEAAALREADNEDNQQPDAV